MQDTVGMMNKIDEALEYLNENAPSLYSNVLNLGQPRLTSEIDTAGVGINPFTRDLDFLLGEQMMGELAPAEIATVMVHESLHVLLNHVEAYDQYADQETLNKAMDAVINDFLINAGFQMPQGNWQGFSGHEQLGVDCSDKSISEVYDLVVQESSSSSSDGGEEEQSDDQNGQGNSQGFDSHEWMKEMSQSDKNRLQDIVDGKSEAGEVEAPDELDANKEDYDTDVSRGLGEGAEREIVEAGISLKWVDLLRRIDPDIIPEPSYLKQNVASWNRINRKVINMYPEILLPTYEATHEREGWGNQKPSIVMCLDTSGSVSKDDVAMFLALAKSLPRDRVDLKLIGFHSNAYRIDLDKPRIVSGGTSFASAFAMICDDIKGNMSEFPKAVIVITDMQDHYGPSYNSYYGMSPAQKKYPMYETIKKYNLEDNFTIMHNYKTNATASRYLAGDNPFNRDNVISMYDLIEQKTLKSLAAETSYERGY